MENKRVVYFDVLNILAALSVIFLHCNGNVHSFSNTLGWKQALIIEVICYWAVPVFLMLTGANLMNYREKYSTKEFFKKRFLRAVIPFLAWTLIVAIEKGINPMEIGEKAFINAIVNSKINNVYWFFIPLFGVYISMPVLSLLKDNHKILWYMVGGAFLLNSVFPSIFRYLGLTWNGSLSMMTVTGLLIYPIIGYLFSVTEFTKKQRMIIYLLGIFGIVLRYSGVYIMSMQDGAINKLFFGYASYYAIFQACAVFTFFKYLPLCKKLAQSDRARKILKTLSGCSLGIYLMHMTVYRFLAHYIQEYCWEWRLLVPFLIYAICLVATLLLKKIPILRNIVP